MTLYADPELCPDCREPMPYGSPSCPACGLSLQGPLAAQLFTALSTADSLLTRMRAQAEVTVGAEVVEQPTPMPAAQPAQSARTSRTRRTAPHRGLSTASVPKILLGLGAICVLIAALVFLAVAWSAMGVGGRTATLVGFTLVAAGLAWWAARADLRAAAESLGLVALGLLSFDLVGARDSGWFGEISTPEFLVVQGVVVAAVGSGAAVLVRRTPVGALVGAEAVAVLGLATGATGLVSSDWLPWSPALTLTVLVTTGAVLAARPAGLRVLSVGAGALVAGSWLVLTGSALERALLNPSADELLLEAEAWPLLTAAALVGGLALVRTLPQLLRAGTLAVAEILLAVAVLVPFTDESAGALTLAGAVLLVLGAAVLRLTPRRWVVGPAVPVALGTAWMGATAVGLSLIALERSLEAAVPAWAAAPAAMLPARFVDTTPSGAVDSWLLPVAAVAMAAAVVALARAATWFDRLASPLSRLGILAAIVAAVGIATVALYAVPVWLVAALLLLTTAGLVVWSLRVDDAAVLGLSVAFLAVGVAVSLYTEWLTLAAVLVGVLGMLAVHLRWPLLEVSALAGFALSCFVGATAWTTGALSGASGSWAALAGVAVLAALVLGLPYVDERLRRTSPASVARLGTEAGALAAAFALSLAGVEAVADVDQATWVAVYLTITGAAVSAMALLRRDRRRAGWLGGLLLAAATWVRLSEIGVEAPEAYTLPSALALLVVGVVHLRREPAESTMTALSPGLALALVPSLIWVLADPVTTRSLLLGAACLALVLGGTRLRWSAPVVFGAVVGAALVLRHATPVAEAVPRWGLIGTAGALLITMGITWERRVREARALAGYVRALR